MHELSVIQSVLDIVLDYAKKYNARKVKKINLEIGELSGFIPEWIQTYFDFVSKDTIAEKAKLVIKKIPAKIKCVECGKEFGVKKDKLEFTCPRCKSTDIELLQGREYFIKSIEVD